MDNIVLYVNYISILKSWVERKESIFSPNVNTKNKNYNMSDEVFNIRP